MEAQLLQVQLISMKFLAYDILIFTNALINSDFAVAMEAGNKDIGVMLYAHMNFDHESQDPDDSPSDSSTRRIKTEEAEVST